MCKYHLYKNNRSLGLDKKKSNKTAVNLCSHVISHEKLHFQLFGLKELVCHFQELTKFYCPTVNPSKTPCVTSKIISANLTCLFPLNL